MTNEEKARELVDKLLDLVGEWLQTGANEKIEKIANEFLFDDIIAALDEKDKALKQLMNEILGLLHWEPELRYLVGNTNVEVLKLRVKEAERTLEAK